MIASLQPIPWWEAEPARLRRDQREVTDQFTGLELILDGNGGWRGILPLWPFARPEPSGLRDLLHDKGLDIQLEYSAAHPMVAPLIFPREPRPEWIEHTQTQWHVLPGGALCLMQSDGAWDPASSIVELLLKAAGWHVEYALMKSGLIDAMTMNGIVSDDSLDALVLEAAGKAQRGTDYEGEMSV